VDEPALTTDERTRAADLFEAHHEEVVSRLIRALPSLDRAMLHDAFVRALLEISKTPGKFDPHRGSSVSDFLYGAAGQHLRTLVRSDRRRQRRDQEKGKTLVADEHSAARTILDTLADSEEAEQARNKVARTAEEQDILRLWELGYSDAEIANERRMDLSAAHQIRDRVVQRLRRLRPSDEEKSQ
jgi:hypothetical protein